MRKQLIANLLVNTTGYQKLIYIYDLYKLAKVTF